MKSFLFASTAKLNSDLALGVSAGITAFLSSLKLAVSTELCESFVYCRILSICLRL